MLLRQPLINRRRQKEPGLAVDRPEVAHRRNILEKRSKRALILSGPSRGVKSDRLLGRVATASNVLNEGVQDYSNPAMSAGTLTVPVRHCSLCAARSEERRVGKEC